MTQEEFKEIEQALMGKILICTIQGLFEWVGTVGAVKVDGDNVALIVNKGKDHFLGCPTLEEARELINTGKCTFKWHSKPFELRVVS